MRTLFFVVLATAALAAAPSDATPAQDNAKVRRVLEAAGLMGTWGTDCNAMASTTGWEVIEVDARGVVQSSMGGDDSISTFDIIDARRIDARHIWMKMLYIPDEAPDNESGEISPDQANTVVYLVEPNRQMTWSSAGPDGEPTVTDGVYVQAEGDQRSEWYDRCPKGIPTP